MDNVEKKPSGWRMRENEEPRAAAMAGKTYAAEEMDLQDLLDLVGYQITELKAQAKVHLDNFWDCHMGANAGKSLSEKSTLGCRMRLKGDSIYLEWFHNYWHRGISKKTGLEGQIPHSKYISRGKGFSYPIKTLLRYSREWEYDTVIRTEEAFTLIRRQNHFLAQARQNIREVMKSREALDVLDGIQKAS